MNNFKKDQKLDLKVTAVNHNHLSVSKGDTEAYLYHNQMPKATVELLIVNDDEDKIVMVEEMIGDSSKLVLPGGSLEPDESSGETGVRLLKEYLGVTYETGDLELYDFRTNPGRDKRQWTVSVIYIARIEDTGEDYWGKIKDILLIPEDQFGYDHRRVIQNYEWNC
jgi:ADP-ribose pyrophosphatase YjhB (NUDIX family)